MDAKGKEEECSVSEDDDEHKEPGGEPAQENTGQEASAGGEAINTCVGPLYKYQPVLENVPSHPSIVSFGKRRSGKSTSTDNWMFHCIQHLPFGIVITRTKLNGFWQTRVPEHLVFDCNDLQVTCERLLARQKEMMAQYGEDNPKVFAFVILDDVIADQKLIRYTPALNTLFVEGRHYRLTVLICSQNIKGVGPMIRGNCDLIFLQPIYNVGERQALYELYAGFMEKKQWYALMDEVIHATKLEGHTALEPRLKVQIMVVQDFEQVPDASEKFFWWDPVHSSQLPNYKLCHPIYWKQAEQAKRMKGMRKSSKPAGDTPGHPADVLQKVRSGLTTDFSHASWSLN